MCGKGIEAVNTHPIMNRVTFGDNRCHQAQGLIQGPTPGINAYINGERWRGLITQHNQSKTSNHITSRNTYACLHMSQQGVFRDAGRKLSGPTLDFK